MKTKKFLALILAMLMMLALGTTAFADTSDGQTGTITVANPQGDATYTAYKIFDVTYDGDHYSYTFKANSPWFSTVSAYADDKDNGLTLTAAAGTADSVIYVVSTTSDFDAATFAQTLKDANITDTSAKTLTNGSVNGIELGYWFVTTTSGSLCNLTTTNPTQTIYDKNEKPTIDKTVDDKDLTVEVGQVLTYTLTATLPKDITGYSTYTYEISDNMSEGLTYREITSFKIGGSDASSLLTATGVTYLHSGISATSETGTPDSGFVFSIDLASDADYEAYLGKTIEIKYTAIVNEKAIKTSKEDNTVTLKYSNDPADKTKTGTDTKKVTVYTLNIDILKVDAEDDNIKLSDAEFILYKEENGTKTYYEYPVLVDGFNKVNWADSTDSATVRITDENGKLDEAFYGLDAGTYYLEEIKAPTGYNLPASPFKVVITKNVDSTTGEVTFTAALGENNLTVDGTTLTATAEITNASGTILPTTGGIGTTIFYITGSILLVGAAVLLITKKRMSAKNN